MITTNRSISSNAQIMATKRKKSGELWLSKPDSLDGQLQNSDQILPKYIELRQKIELLEEEKDKNLKKLKKLEETIQEANSKCANHLQQLSELKSLVAKLEFKLEKKNEQYNQVIKQLENEKEQFHQQEEKWQVFQKDLLTTVRVANDLKTEAEEQSDLLLNENKTLSNKIASLENELSKLKVNKFDVSKSNLQNNLNTNMKTDSNCDLTNDYHYSLKNEIKNNLENDLEDCKFNNLDKNKLLKQQSNDSVFSNSFRESKLNQRNTSQSLILNANNKISVKSLVKTIENASNTNKAINKSPSFNCINLNALANNFGNSVGGNVEESKPYVFSNSKYDNHDLNDKIENIKSNQSKLDSKFENNKIDINKQANNKFNQNLINDKLISQISTSPRSFSTNLVNIKKENCLLNNNNESNALNNLIKEAGSIRNGLLSWCKKKTENYEGIEISNFSSSWKDSLVICALLHSLDQNLIPFHTLDRTNKKKNFKLAFNAAESIGIQCNLNIEDLINEERPDWSKIMAYVTSIYNHFENESH